MLRTGVITDELWALISPLLPDDSGRPGRPWNDHRVTLEGIAWRFRAGSAWRDLPTEFGAWQSVWERHRRWSTDGTYERVFAEVRGSGSVNELSARALLSVDSTSVRAHQHAAGARVSGPQVLTGGLVELQGSSRRAS